jgi:hypothetical protein
MEKRGKKKVSEKKKFEKVDNFKKEFNNSINTAIVAAFGFLIALAWRDVITGFVDSISQTSPVQGKLISALIITLVGVLGIMLTSKLFAKKE